MIVRLYKQKEIRQKWDVLSTFIKESIEQSGCDDYDVIDLKRLMESETLLTFVPERDGEPVGIVVISLIPYPKQLIAFICAYGGKFITNDEGWDELLHELKQYKVTKIQGYVRDSLIKLTDHLGFKAKQTLVEYKL